jgi:hypothetical protein
MGRKVAACLRPYRHSATLAFISRADDSARILLGSVRVSRRSKGGDSQTAYPCQTVFVGRKARGLWPKVASSVVAAGVAGLALFVWLSPHRSALEAFGSFVLAIAVPAVSLAVYLTRVKRPGDLAWARSADDVADLLARAVKEQWIRAAADRSLLQAEPIPVRWKRSSQQVAGPISAAVGSRQFPPLPGLTAVGQGQLRGGGLGDLHALYGGLGSGWMVITGAPGAGKSGAAVLLLLAALRYREQVPAECRPLVPVPVIFTLHGWDPSTERAGDWLAAQLRLTYPLLAGTGGSVDAAALVAAGKIAVILDGLDEIPGELRPVALRALSEQAVFRLVVLTRSAEMAATARRSFLEGAVALELQDVHPPAAASYLIRVQRDPPPPGWRELTGRLRRAPASPLALALVNPLTLTLVRDLYRDADVGDLLSFCDAAGDGLSREDIEDYLLDRVLPMAYAVRPGQAPPRYELQGAQRALSYVAMRMNQEGTRDLAWWHVPAWTSRLRRIITGAVVAGLGLLGALAGLMIGLLGGPHGWSLGLGLGAGLVAAVVAGRGARGGGSPGRMTALRWQHLFSRSALIAALAGGLLFGFLFGLLGFLAASTGGSGSAGLVLVGLVFGLVAGVMTGLGGNAGGSSARMAVLRWRQMFSVSSLTTGLLAGFVTVLAVYVGIAHGDLTWALVDGLIVGIVIWLVFGLGTMVSTGLTQPEATDTSPLTPPASWRRDQTARLVAGLAGGVTAGLLVGLLLSVWTWPENGLTAAVEQALIPGLLFGLTAGLIFGLTHAETWPVSLTFIQLTRRQHTPIRLMRLLEDARERQILRTVGPIYQFRHARLQDRLAGETATTRFPQSQTSHADHQSETPD